MTFNRYGLFEKRTLAWRLFKRHHTHLNDIYWSYRTSFTYTFAGTRGYDKSDATSSVFAFAKDNKRVAPTLEEWADHYLAFDRWTRMALVVAIAGYLETFIAQIGTAALESDPSRVFGGGPKIDGSVYIKHNSKYNLYSHAEPLTRGSWQSRASTYVRLFGSCPYDNPAVISDLERLRKLRNDAGHSFGRDIGSMSFAPAWLVQKLPRIDEAHLTGLLAVVEEVAWKIESQLAPIVGQYEVVKIFHRWLPTSKSSGAAKRLLAKEFSVHFNALTGTPYGKNPAIELIAYYESL